MSGIKEILSKHGVPTADGQSMETKQLINDLTHHTLDCIIEELELVHRVDGEGLPKRDYDNETDEYIDERIEFLKYIRDQKNA